MACVLGTMTFGWSKASSECDEAKAKDMTELFLKSNPQHTEIDTAFLVKYVDIFVKSAVDVCVLAIFFALAAGFFVVLLWFLFEKSVGISMRNAQRRLLHFAWFTLHEMHPT